MIVIMKNFCKVVAVALLGVLWSLTSCGPDEPELLELNPGTVTLDISANSTASISITCDGDWFVDTKPEWVNVSATSGTGNSSITITALSNNESSSSRTGDLVVKSGSKTARILITQLGKVLDVLEVNPSSISLVSTENATASVNIKCNGTWEITSKPNWINVSSTAGKGDVTINVSALTKNDSASPRTGELNIVSGSSTAKLLITQQPSLQSGCEVTVVDDVVLNTSATFRLRFGSNAAYFYAVYFAASYAGWSDEKLIEEIEKNSEPMNAENDVDITAGDLSESTKYIQCFVAYDEKGNRGEVIRRIFTTPSSKDAPMAYIENVRYNSSYWTWSTIIGGTATSYYVMYWTGDVAVGAAMYLEPSDFAMIFKDNISNLTPYRNNNEKWQLSRTNNDILICTWAKVDNQWSSFLNRFWGHISEDSPSNTSKILSNHSKSNTFPNDISKDKCVPHYASERESAYKHIKIMSK